MPLPPYSTEDKPSASDRVIISLGSALIGFVACFIVGGAFLSLVRAHIFGFAGGCYGVFALLCGILLLTKKWYRGFSAGIFCASMAWFFLMMLVYGFSRGYW